MTHPLSHLLCIVVLLGVMVGSAPAGILTEGDGSTFNSMLNSAVAPTSHDDTFDSLGTFGENEEVVVELRPTQAKYPDPRLATTTEMEELISEAGIASSAEIHARPGYTSGRRSFANTVSSLPSMNEPDGMVGLTTTIPFNASLTRDVSNFLTVSISGQ